MSKKYIVRLKAEERKMLEGVVRKGKSQAYRIKHANILLNADAGGPDRNDADIAGLLNCHCKTVANVRQRFVEQGLEAALERKKREQPPTPKKLDGEREAKLIAIACSQPPQGRAKWTLHMLADKLIALEVVDSISHETVRQALKKTN